MKLLLSGATGAAGSQILRTALADPQITSITILARRPLPAWSPASDDSKPDPNSPGSKPTDVIVLSETEFLKYPPAFAQRLAQHDACIWALGTSSVGMSEADYTRVTYDYVVAAVQALRDGGLGSAGSTRTKSEPFRFVFISGEGASPTATQPLFARVKGATEKYLTSLPPSSSIHASIYRPAYFFPSAQYPTDRQGTRGALARAFDLVATPAFRTLAPKMYSPIDDFGRFVVELAKGRWEGEGEGEGGKTFVNGRMREIMKNFKA